MLKKTTITLTAITLHLFTSLLNKKLIFMIYKTLILVYLRTKLSQTTLSIYVIEVAKLYKVCRYS
jgi:hypothetical protein